MWAGPSGALACGMGRGRRLKLGLTALLPLQRNPKAKQWVAGPDGAGEFTGDGGPRLT